MLNYIWPIALVIISNVLYQVCAKSTPADINPFASLSITYAVALVFCLGAFFITSKGANLFGEYSKLNWAPVVLGTVIIGLEVGFIFAYKAGWQVSTASIVQSSVLAVALIFVGALAFKESITWNKLVGIVICLVGLVFVNIK